MDKYFLVEIQRYVDAGGKLTHQHGVEFFNRFIRRGGKLSHDDSLALLHILGRLEKRRSAIRMVHAASAGQA